MAQTKSASRTKSKAAARGKAAPAAPKKTPVRREVAGLICLILGLFTFIGYFQQDFWLLDAICLYMFKGLFGWGFLVVPPCFFWAAWVLLFHKGRPVAARAASLAVIPFLFGAVVHLMVCKEEFGFSAAFIRSLYLGGINLESYWLLGGALLFVISAVLTLCCMTFIHAVTARLKVEHLFKFYWTVVAGLALISLVLVWLGL